MNKKDIFDKYIKIAKFIAEINGKNCEVLVHDISNLEESIIYVVNGHVTNRQIGGGITNYALSVIMDSDYRQKDYVVNYIGRGKNNSITRSSTYYIKDEDELIGLLCVNYDITGILEFQKELKDILIINEENKQNKIDEVFDYSLDDVINEIIAKSVIEADQRIPLNHVENKKNPINIMHKLGLFKVKGSIDKVAKLYGISSQTVYRYINDIEKNVIKSD